MKRQHYHVISCLCTFILLVASCTDKVAPKAVCGTLEAPVPEDSVPSRVQQAMDNAIKYHQYEILSDTANHVSVCCIAEADDQPTEGFGIVIVKNSTSTTFRSIRNTRQPSAVYDSTTGNLWLTASAMEGTGVQVERLYQFQFEGDSAVVRTVIDPYDMQQAIGQRLGYTTEGEQITLYIDHKPATTVTNTVTDMGGFDEDALWIGEQLSYDLSNGQPLLCVTPGVKFITGLVLHYDDMPTITAALTPKDGTFELSDVQIR